jgi:DegV family protein with EDD domain
MNYPDGHEMDNKQFYKLVRGGQMSTTGQVTVQRFTDIFEPLLNEGYDLLYIAFSSGLSGTYSSSCVAVEELAAKHPERKIYTVDSLAASMGEGLLVYHAVMQKRAGLSIDELKAWVEENRSHLCHWFTVDDLNHLKKGGRVSPAAALFGTMLGIKPVLHVDDEGHLIPMEKVRGRKQSLDALVRHMTETVVNPENQVIFISHGDCLEDAQYVANEVRSKMKVKDVFINFVGPVIGAHSGPGTVALFFLGTHK